MPFIDKKKLKKFYEEEAKQLTHQETMYVRGDKHKLWWHRKRLYYIFSFLSEIIKVNDITTFADIGCAEGFYVKCIASFHSEIFCVGADIARTYIKKAKAKMNNSTLNCDYIVCDIENLPIKSGSIDVVLCSEVLEHVYNYHGALDELYRVGKKYLVISFPGHSYLYKVFCRIKPIKRLVDNLVPNVGHISDVKVSDVQAFLESKCATWKIKIAGVLPLRLYTLIPWVRIVETIDTMLCKILERFGAVKYVTIHVMEIMKNGD